MSQLHPSPGDPHDIKEVHILVNIPETDLSVVVAEACWATWLRLAIWTNMKVN